MRTCESLRADVTYIPMRRGFLHLVAIMGWTSRNFLAWRLSNTMDADLCVAALKMRVIPRSFPREPAGTRAGVSFWLRGVGGEAATLFTRKAKLSLYLCDRVEAIRPPSEGSLVYAAVWTSFVVGAALI
jgi:hypothetical protein